MKNFPKLVQLKSNEEMNQYAMAYEECSKLPVPVSYLSVNKTFALMLSDKMIGGFILGNGPRFRTINFFASPENQPALMNRMESLDQYTEITCFWLDKSYRSQSFVNLLTWAKLALAIKKHSNPYLLFGTNSRGLARLYNIPAAAQLIHSDYCNCKSTYVFIAETKNCIRGITEIILFKVKRIINCKRKYNAVAVGDFKKQFIKTIRYWTSSWIIRL